jgi:hypothetical protein
VLSQNLATYTVHFESNWSQETHPHSSGSLPNNAHWSPLVGVTHNDQVSFLELGDIATQGIENVAELGVNTVFFDEINFAVSNNNALESINGAGLNTSLGAIIINEINASTEYPYLTLISMIAPSPDWFISINNILLLDNQGNFIEEIILDVYPTDAGTDSGMDYLSANSDVTPHNIISSLIGISPFSSEKIGTITISLINVVLGIEDSLFKETVLMYPNPTKEFLTIFLAFSKLNNVEIYNSIGNKVKTYQFNNSSFESINISNLSSGIYFVKIQSELNKVVFKKMIKI